MIRREKGIFILTEIGWTQSTSMDKHEVKESIVNTQEAVLAGSEATGIHEE